MACWVLPELIGSGTAVAKTWGTTSGNSYKLWVLTDGDTSWETSTGSAGDIVTTFIYPPGEWVHLAGVWDGAEKALYINGVEAVRGAETRSAFDRGRVVIGADLNSGSPTSFYEGRIDDVRVYRRALTDPEIAALASSVGAE